MKNGNLKPLAPIISLQNSKASTTEKEPLTIDTLRACRGNENLTEEQLTERVRSLKAFVEIVVLTYIKNKNVIDNQQIIYLNSENKEAA